MTARVKDELSDSELTRCAQAGDAAALGVLLQRHQAGMRAVALAVLGYGPDVEDVLQDAALTALRHIGEVRDPAAVGAWLRAIVRNACRMRFRSRDLGVPLSEAVLPPSTEMVPEQVAEAAALRDWIWTAMGELSPSLRLVVMLRHFSGVTSYEQIAEACELPIGTVRSRLNQARSKMATALLATADREHDSAEERNRATRCEAQDTLAAAEAGRFADIVADRWSPHVTLTAQGVEGDRDLLLAAMDDDLAAGVRQRPIHTVAGPDVAVWEMALINPSDNPDHCPPSVVWMLSLAGGRVQRLRLFHPVRR